MPASTNENSLLCGILAFITAALGYYLRARVSDKTSSRKEDWEKINKIVDQINDLTDAAQEYYCHPPIEQDGRKKLGLNIQSRLRKIRQDAVSLPFDRPASNLDGYHQRLRQAVTMHLGESSIEPLEQDHPTIQDITIACGSYVGAIQLAYRRKYRTRDQTR